MRVCAVICEYNPFHLGHAYHLRAAREASGADYVLCLMSGALTQRGAFARHDKWLRARAALENGADLVLELPTRFACAPAPDFASGGVALLSALGVATHLSFGCEASALPLLSAAAALFKAESPAFSAALRARLAGGLPYPRARALAAEQLLRANGPPVCPPPCWRSPTPPSRWNTCKPFRQKSPPCPSSAGAAAITTRRCLPSPAQPPSAQPWRGAA